MDCQARTKSGIKVVMRTNKYIVTGVDSLLANVDKFPPPPLHPPALYTACIIVPHLLLLVSSKVYTLTFWVVETILCRMFLDP